MHRLFIVLFLLLQPMFNAQDALDNALKILGENYAQEKVFLLTDQEKYIAGDKIRFKAFVFEGYRKTEISGTLFVELYGADRKIIARRTVSLRSGVGGGSIQLNETLPENVYYLRAHTPWMSNFSQEYDAVKPLAVYNPSSAQKLVNFENKQWEAFITPEGNTLLADVDTRFAVRLLSAGVPPANWQGYVVATSNPEQKLVSFKNLDENIAEFRFTPKFNKDYILIITDSNGRKQELKLPSAQRAGVSLSTQHIMQGIKYTLKAQHLPQGLANYKVVGTINNKLAYRANIKTATNEISATVPTGINDGEAGVLLLSVFDAKNLPVASRLVFVNEDKAKVSTDFVKSMVFNKNPRAENTLQIDTAAVKAPFVFVVRYQQENYSDSNQNNLLSTLWLTGDFKKPIYNAAQYFEKNSNHEALDALLISENWTRFKWEDVLAGKKPTIKTPKGKFLHYEGYLTQAGRVLPNTVITMSSKVTEGEFSVVPYTTDQFGRIFLNNVFIDEPLRITYQLNEFKNINVPVDLRLNFKTNTPVSYTAVFPSVSLKLHSNADLKTQGAAIAKAIQNRKNEKLLEADVTEIEEVTIAAKKRNLTRNLDKQLTSNRFKSSDQMIMDFVNEEHRTDAFNSIFDYLKANAPSLTVERSGHLLRIKIRGQPAKVYLDEFEVFNLNEVLYYPMNNIAMVKILRNSAVGEALAIYSRQGHTGPVDQTKITQNNQVMISGYDKEEEPITINLTKEWQDKLRTDTREILYWNTISDTAGTRKVDFLNNDSVQTLQVVAVAFNENGTPVYYEQTH